MNFQFREQKEHMFQFREHVPDSEKKKGFVNPGPLSTFLDSGTWFRKLKSRFQNQEQLQKSGT